MTHWIMYLNQIYRETDSPISTDQLSRQKEKKRNNNNNNTDN